MCGRESCSSTEDWNMAGNDRYIFEFVIPASDTLHVLMTGEDQDGFTFPDSLWYAQGEYIER